MRRTHAGPESIHPRRSSAGVVAALCATLLAVCLAAPELAQACSVCGIGREENRVAFILTTVLLTLLPLAAVGGIVGWLVRRARTLEAASRETHAPAEAPLSTSPASLPGR